MRSSFKSARSPDSSAGAFGAYADLENEYEKEDRRAA